MSLPNKEKYKALCECETSIPLYLQYWWMETVCMDKNWDVLLYTDNGEITAAMPFLFGKKLWFRYILQPQLTQYTGIWYKPQAFRTENDRLGYEKKVVNYFFDELKPLKISYFQQNFSPQFTNWLPFYWKGFSQTTRYTCQIQDISDLDSVFGNFDVKERQKKIRKTEGRYSTVIDITPSEFYDFHQKYWKARGQKDKVSEKFVVNLCTKAIERGNGMIVGLADAAGKKVAMRFVVFDEKSACTLLSARLLDAENGVTELLFWRILQMLSGKTKIFDFEGSMDEGIEYSYRCYGARQVPYFQITKCNSRLFGLLLKIKTKK